MNDFAVATRLVGGDIGGPRSDVRREALAAVDAEGGALLATRVVANARAACRPHSSVHHLAATRAVAD
jgi:hypothetical protein